MNDEHKKLIRPIGGTWEDIEFEQEEKPLASFDDGYWRIIRSETKAGFDFKDSIVFNQKQETIEVVEEVLEKVVGQPVIENTAYQPFIKPEGPLKIAASLINLPDFFKASLSVLKDTRGWFGEIWTKYIMGPGIKEAPQNKNQAEAQKQKAEKKRNKFSFIENLRSILRSPSKEQVIFIQEKKERLNLLINKENLSYSGHMSVAGEETEYAKTLAEKTNSELTEKENQAKKEASIAAARGKRSNLLNLDAQEGNSMVANQIMTAG